MKTKKSAPIAIIALATLGIVSSSHASILIDYTFDGIANDIGPAVQQFTNGIGTGGSSSTSTGLITTGSAVNSTYGLNSSGLVSLTGYTSFTATFVIDSIAIGSTAVADLASNGMFFGVVAGPEATNTDATGIYAQNGLDSFGYVPGSGNWGDHAILQNVLGPGGVTTDSIASAQPSDASLKDGFTVSLTVNNDDTWSVASTGLSTDLSDNGTIAGLWSTFSPGIGLNTSLQGAASGQLDMASMTLTAIPEPSTCGLLLISLVGGLVRSRRRRA